MSVVGAQCHNYTNTIILLYWLYDHKSELEEAKMLSKSADVGVKCLWFQHHRFHIVASFDNIFLSKMLINAGLNIQITFHKHSQFVTRPP